MRQTYPALTTSPPRVGLKSRCRRLAAIGIIVPVPLQLFRKSGTYTGIFEYHPICMMLAFVMVMPDAVRDSKQLRQGHRRSPLEDRPPRHEIIMRHQLASFLMELAAAGGFAAVEYTKLKKHYPHLQSLHSIVGTFCGLTIVCQIVLGSILRYLLAPANPKRPIVRTVHCCVSATIAVTAMMAMAGGFLATEYAERMIPPSLIRTAIVLAAVATTVAGFLM
ncbi:ferric reductase transmembrane protein-like protein [Leishmania infantum JPCM5]|uniref:Ferric_reductase_transmembrane_protein-like_protein n=2 Tax=Leishmania infantum TaxID=5671 RepID=A0A6L0XUV0_LEIIN|nr:ferric reductase transmembrane protein-like protein [Leishmania infantum JPCM5]CAC9514205.1 ferric_reductase_transmembrane_protein-like_protein [Leishmania infantum]CAM70102.1 ferric reductase transmembrane protein-like protein [Leishmania infantum JPCM5]SUZ44022.1 ferric_reductase_transmembrane_protein-like_protein [Leishmania infantum]|eukprot:XP_001467051.1 ferric reductase transmembrane protein-like protein [Leishmania infantum JPCM5]